MVFDQALGLLSNELAIDMGTSTTLIYVRGRGVVVEEPSVVAVERPSGRVVAFGLEAKRMVGRTPEHISAAQPIQEGIIQDFPLAESLLGACVERALGGRGLVRPRLIASVPHGTDIVQRRAVADSARSVGCRELTLVSALLAAGIGCGLPIGEPVGSLVIDIGGGTSEIGVLTLGGLASATAIPTAGDDLDDAIVQWVRERHHLLIGERTAEEIKLAVGCAISPREPRAVQVTGRDLREGIPREITISSRDVSTAIQAPLARIVEAIQKTLSTTLPELAADIYEHGMVLCGGSAQLPELEAYLTKATGLRTTIATDPHRCVVMGAGMLLEDEALLKRAALV
jgi:rod shape-determining protein MreB